MNHRDRKEHRLRTLERKLAAYGAAATALLVGAADAQAQGCTGGALVGTHCYQDVNPDVTVSTNNGTFDLDFDGDGTAEFILKAVTSASALMLESAANANGFRGYYNVYVYANALPSNYSITAGQAFRTIPYSFSSATMAVRNLGPWPGQTDKFLGVRLNFGGNTHFGWARLNVGANSSSFTVKDLAYNTTPDAGIPTGFASLPVELTRFDALTDGSDVLLQWETASETNNAGFEVQLLENPEADWRPVSFVSGYGTTLEAQHYEHRIAGLQPGRYQFRLKQVDYDGAFEYSPEIEATVAVPGAYVLSAVYPNPFNPQAQFSLAVERTQHVRVVLYDLLGREAQVVHAGPLGGGATHHLTVDGTGLPSGTYLLRVEGEGFAESRRVSLIK